MNNRQRTRKYVVIAVGVSVATVVLISFLTMDRGTLKAVSRIDIASFVVVLGLVVGKWLGECLRFDLIIRAIGRRLPFSRTAKSVLGSAFTGAVTPYRSATIPVQIFFFTRYGLSGGEATAVAATGAALSVLLLVIAMPIILVTSASVIHLRLGIRAMLIIAAFIGFFVFIAAIYSMRDPSRVSRFLERVTPRFVRRKTRFERLQQSLTRGMGDFSKSLRVIFKAPKIILLLIALLTLSFWLSEIFVAAWILRGLGFGQYFWKAVLAQIVVSSVLPFTPVPGESGFAEATFAGVFSIFVKKNVVGLVMIVWRFFMFYLPLAGLGTAFILAMKDAGRLGRKKESGEESHVTQPSIDGRTAG